MGFVQHGGQAKSNLGEQVSDMLGWKEPKICRMDLSHFVCLILFYLVLDGYIDTISRPSNSFSPELPSPPCSNLPVL